MEQIKLVVTDLDDTLLSPEKEISPSMVETIRQLSKKKVLFTFITGRPPYAIQRFAEKVRITAPIVACNGAMLLDAQTMQTREEVSLPLKPLEHLLTQAAELGMTILVLAGNTEYTLTETPWTQKRRDTGREVPLISLETLLASDRIYKVNIMAGADRELFAGLIPQIRCLESYYSISLYGTSGCEIVAKGIDKAFGLRKLCKACGLSPEQVLAIGDNENDIPMIRQAGIGAAVGNAVESVKQVADYVCRNTCTDGAEEAIHHFVK